MLAINMDGGVYRSTDSRQSFSRAFPTVPGLGEAEVEYVTSVAVNPTDPDDLAASTAKTWPVWYSRGSVWRSTSLDGAIFADGFESGSTSAW